MTYIPFVNYCHVYLCLSIRMFTAIMPMVAAGLIADDPTLQPISRLISLVGFIFIAFV